MKFPWSLLIEMIQFRLELGPICSLRVGKYSQFLRRINPVWTKIHPLVPPQAVNSAPCLALKQGEKIMSVFKGSLPQFVNSLAIVITIGIAFMGWTSSPAHSSTLNIQLNGTGTSDDVLLGVNGLNVGGTNYNVLFVDNTCVLAFAGCDVTTDFDFQNQTDAVAAAQALLNSISGSFFDAPPTQVFGLGASSIGNIFIPYNRTFNTARDGTITQRVVIAGVRIPGTALPPQTTLDIFSTFTTDPNFDSATNDTQVFADFTAVSPVPLPAALPFFGTGLAVMGFIGWRRKRKISEIS